VELSENAVVIRGGVGLIQRHVGRAGGLFSCNTVVIREGVGHTHNAGGGRGGRMQHGSDPGRGRPHTQNAAGGGGLEGSLMQHKSDPLEG
jgi:hypothetical protein